MGRVRLQALALSCVMVFSIFTCGCGSKKSSKNKDENRQAMAMLDDFCAYLKRGKYGKMEKMIDGKSKQLEKLKDYQASDAKDLLEAASSRIIYDIEDLSIDDDEGEAVLNITYFDVKALAKEITADSSNRDIRMAISAAKEKDLEFTCKLSYDDDWLIDSDSVDEIAEELFSFLSDMEITVKPTDTDPIKAQTLTEFSNAWYDETYNIVLAYHQSEKFIRFMVTFWEQCYGETITFEFCDELGNTFTDKVTVDNGDDFVYCEWSPDYRLPAGWLSCTVYDSAMRIITVGCIEIYDDAKPIPQQIYAFGCQMINKDGDPVPGYHVSDSYIAAKLSLDRESPDTELSYTYYKKSYNNNGQDEIVWTGSVKATSTNPILPLSDTSNLTAGEYYVAVYDASQNLMWQTWFSILEADQQFTQDDTSATCYLDAWLEDPDMFTFLQEIPKGATEIIYFIQTGDYYNYMVFTYEVTDGKNKKILEGECSIVSSDMIYITVPLTSPVNGSLTIRVYNPDGSLLRESTIEEET